MHIHFKRIKYKNLLSIGNTPIELRLDKSTTTLITAKNGSGKCLEKSTLIDIAFKSKDVEDIFNIFVKKRK